MYKISESNPKDKVLDEIHEIQKRISREDTSLNIREKIRKYSSAREEIEKKYKHNFKTLSIRPAVK